MEKNIYIIHENDEWLIPLRESFKKIKAPYKEWHMNKVNIDLKGPTPSGVFYNRMSASSHSRGHRYAPEKTRDLLKWLERGKKRIINNSRALELEISKIEQYKELEKFNIKFPKTLSTKNKNELIERSKEFNKPFLIGAHISEGVTLPSGEKLSEITKKIEIKNLLGLILACGSPENYEKNINEIKSIGFPFGFKINAFEKTKIQGGYTKNYGKSKSGNPNEFLGKRNDLTPTVLKNLAKKFIDDGATIIGGCCETNPSHIKAFSELK